MAQPGLSEFIVESPAAASAPASAPAAAPAMATPQRFYPMPPPAAIFVASPKVKKSSNRLLIALVIVLVLVIAYAAMRFWKKKSLGDHLASQGWVLYTKPGCGFCTKQLALLGARYPKTVVCSGQNPACKKIQAFPLWANVKTHKTRTGFQGQKQLEGMLHG